jgi:hypothetical protein
MLRISAPDTWLWVTGIPRGGTTFVGRILSVPRSVDFIHEPFNPDCAVEGIDQLYVYTREGLANEPSVNAAVRGLQDYRARIRTGYYPNDGPLPRLIKHVVGSRGPFYYRIARYNPWHEAALIKDPVGCLLTAYLIERCNFRGVVVLRHPIGVADSFRRLGYDGNRGLASLREQPEYVDEFLTHEDRKLIERTYDDPRIAAAVLWRMLWRGLAQQACATETPIVRLEDLSADPIVEFRRLYDHFDLPWSDRVERRIVHLTSGDVAAPRTGGPARQFVRDSAGIMAATVERTPREAREAIYEYCGEVAEPWYDESSYCR